MGADDILNSLGKINIIMMQNLVLEPSRRLNLWLDFAWTRRGNGP